MFKWISSIQNAIKDARVNRKGPGRRRQDKSKHGGNHTVDGSIAKHKTAPPESIKFDTDRVEPVSILHCEQKDRPRGPKGRRAPGRAFLHSTILGGSSVGNLTQGSTGDLLAITETNSLESSTEMTASMDSSDNLEHKHNNNHQQMYNHNNLNHHRPRTITTETLDTDAEECEEERDSKAENEEDNHYDTLVNESNRRIIGIMNKMRLEGEEKIKLSNGFGKGDASHDNYGDKQANLISKSNESNGTSNHFHANITRLNGKHINGYSSSSPPINKTTGSSPIIKRRLNEDTKKEDLKKHLNAIFSNNNQQLMVNLGDSTVSIEQTKLTECLKEICPKLTSGSLLSEGSQVKNSLTDLDPNLRSLIKELEALKGVKKSKARNEKIQSLVDKLVNLIDTYSKNVESFENYNHQIIKLVSSLSTLVSHPTPMVTSSSTSSSPSSSPRLVNANKLHYKPVNSPSSTHC